MATCHGEDHAPSERLKAEDHVTHGHKPAGTVNAYDKAQEHDGFQKTCQNDEESAKVEPLGLKCGCKQGKCKNQRNAYEHVGV